MYVRCTDRMNLFKNLNSLNVQNRENSRKIVYIRCTNSTNLLKNSNSLSVKNRENQMKIEEHTKLSKLNGKLITLDV